MLGMVGVERQEMRAKLEMVFSFCMASAISVPA